MASKASEFEMENNEHRYVAAGPTLIRFDSVFIEYGRFEKLYCCTMNQCLFCFYLFQPSY